MNGWISDMKLFLLNGSAFVVSLSTLETSLKILLLLVSIGYTIYKWWITSKRKKNDN